MILKKYCFLLLIAIVAISCTKENLDKDQKSIEPVLKISVFNATTWTSSQTHNPVSGATIVFLDSPIDITLTTNETGVVYTQEFNIEDNYIIKVDKADLSNVLEQTERNDMIVGYITDGIFKTQDDLKNQPFNINYVGDTIYAQPEAQVGDLRIVDVNGDGRITDSDKSQGLSYWFRPYKDLNYDLIINDLDKISGEYLLEDTVYLEVWLGR